MSDNKQKEVSIATAPKIEESQKNTQLTAASAKRRFEVVIYEQSEDAAGNLSWKPIPGTTILEASNKAELDEHARMYEMCAQKFKIIREIDTSKDVNKTAVVNKAETAVAQHVNIQSVPKIIEHVQKIKPKIVTIGDVQLKYDGDRVYQKQWIKLNAIEAANFRVVNDSNNKVVNLTGKHIEAKRWVLVEEAKTDDDCEACEEIING